MAITQITYERLYNLGNYNNERFVAVVVVEDGDYSAAFLEAKLAIELTHAQFQAERAAELERRRQDQETERQAKQAHTRAAAQAWQQQRNAASAAKTDDDWL